MSKGYLRQVFTYLLTVIAFLLNSSSIHAALKAEYKDSLWVAQKHNLQKLSSATGQSLLQIYIDGKIQAVAVNKKQGLVWLTTEQALSVYDLNGERQRSFSLSALLPVKDTSHKQRHQKKYKSLKIIVDESDNSLWLHDKKLLWHVTDQGKLLHRLSIKDKIENITLVPKDKHVWIASKKTIHVFDIDTGQLVRDHKNLLKSKITDLAFDQTLNEVWLADKKTIRRLTPEGEQTYLQDYHHPEIVQPDGKGNLWLATKISLYYIDVSGAILFQLNPFSGERHSKIKNLVVEPANQSVWATSEHALVQVDKQGVIQKRIRLKKDIEDVAFYSDLAAPVLDIVSPAQGDVINTAQPAITLNHSDNGIGTDNNTLKLQKDKVDLPANCQHTEQSSTCLPDVPLDEGLINLSATVKDYIGNTSDEATTSFTVDTIAPTITINSHWNGSYVNQSAQTLSGELSEFALFNINNTPVTLGLNNIFSYPVLLFEGQNNFLLYAEDEATNVSTLPFVLFLDTVPPEAIQAEKVDVSDVVDGQTTITGTAGSVEANAIIEITNFTTNIVTTVQANAEGSFSLTVQASPDDKLSIIVIDKAGNRSTVSELKVPLPLSIEITSHINGVIVEGDSINIEGIFKGAENSGITVNGKVAGIFDNKFFVNNVNLQPGANTVTAYLSLADGTILKHDILVTSNTPSTYYVDAKPYSGMSSLTVNFYINEEIENSIQKINIDFDSDGVVDYNSEDLTLPINYTYILPGKYTSTTTVHGVNGVIHTFNSHIVVGKPAELDMKLRSIYINLLNQLSTGNINEAMNSLTRNMRVKFENSFIQSGSKLAQIIPELGTIKGGSLIGEDLAEYIITREENGEQVAFAIYLIKGRDGVWRIGGM
ncbi:MAG: Ig-like domain-containing protein [Gammaproteobacteria bacterium]|nr:Ig-like domain-containing protein [Gammaproteobacteria bacterium]MCW8986438.1 Ig-like domain-containing protein [Gammaproteobacteria bacterium]MCW9030590.1 Ig-like domain-containing protein [Gammaproteobacteria bacterium]